MTNRLFVVLLILSLCGCRAENRDLVIYRKGTFHGSPAHTVSGETAREAMNGARLEIERRATLATWPAGQTALRFILDHWNSSVCQVVGLGNAESPEVLLRFFPRQMQREEDLTQSEVQVSDGGPAYWSIEYDPKSHRYSSPKINGRY